MSLWPNKGEADPRPAQGAAYRRLEAVKAGHPAVTRYTHESAKVSTPLAKGGGRRTPLRYVDHRLSGVAGDEPGGGSPATPPRQRRW